MIHMKEPWRFVPAEFEEDGEDTYPVMGAGLYGPNRESVYTLDLGDHSGMDDANARRIVSCVNACAGIPDDMVSHVVAFGLQGHNKLSEDNATLRAALQTQAEEAAKLMAQRDVSWQGLREVREAIAANPEESTADEVRRVVAQRDELLAALTEYIAAADNSMDPPDDDDVSAMLRFGEADKAARAAITNTTKAES